MFAHRYPLLGRPEPEICEYALGEADVPSHFFLHRAGCSQPVG